MSSERSSQRITATAAAHTAISRLCAARGAPVMFIQSGGCCAGSTPMCYPEGEFVVGDIDVLLGEIDGCPFYIDRRLDEAWHQDQFLLDVAAGGPEGFSLPAGDNLHFVTRSPTCPVPQAAQTTDAAPASPAAVVASLTGRIPGRYFRDKSQ